ncbi:MAG TPA: type II toxin-antitoxin system VapC family toxin [Candidatus Acidoferrum sp.]|nr:type II toxin-antitoxin system VapC family toxin [Candidatus Acidoferrum sp.]
MISGITILDTNVVSEPMQPSPSASVTAWLSQQPSGTLFITTITEAEILYGIELLPQGRRRAALVAGAELMFGKVLVGRILPFDEDAARAFAGIAASRRVQGRPIATLDAQIVAIAYCRDATLATRNTADFEGCGVRLVNPWAER